MNVFKRLSQVVIALVATVFIAGVIATPSYAATVHNVTFMYGTKTFVEPVAHGANAIPPVDTYVEGYTFLKWVGNLCNVTEDRIILGDYAKVAATCPAAVYTVSFVDGLTGKILSVQNVVPGGYAVAPEVPEHPGYWFSGWSDSYYNVTSNRVIYSTYNGYYWICGVPYACAYSYWGWNLYPYYWYYNNWYYGCYYAGAAKTINAIQENTKKAYDNMQEDMAKMKDQMNEAQKSMQESISSAYDSMPALLK